MRIAQRLVGVLCELLGRLSVEAMTETVKKKPTRSTIARQRAREAMRVEAARQKRMEVALVSAFSAVDAHGEAMVKLGEAVMELKDLGESIASIAERLHIDRKVVSEAWALCRPEPEEDASDGSPADEPRDEGDFDVEHVALEASAGERIEP